MTNHLIARIEDLRGLHVRLHLVSNKGVSHVDGICRGIEGNSAVLSPSSLGGRTEVPLAEIGAVTQLPGEFEGETPDKWGR
jgi:hypothetical protein